MITAARRALLICMALSLLAVYWALDDSFGPFHAVRRYGRVMGGADWGRLMPAGEWAWIASCLVATAAVLLAFFAWPRRAATAPAKGPAPAVRATAAKLAALAVAAVALSAVIRVFVLGGAPLTDDDQAYLFEARTLAGGHWTAPPPPDARAFEHIFLGVHRGRWFGQYTFGHPLLLAVGQRLGAVGAIGALLVGLTVVAVFLLTHRLFGRRAAWLAAGLAAASPLLLCTGATLLAQNSATPLVLLGVWLALRAAESGAFRPTLAAALLLGAAFWCRQQEPAVFALGPLVLLARRLYLGPDRRGVLLGGLLGAALTLGPLALLQWKLWGSPFWTNYQAYWWGYLKYPGASPYGFGAAPWLSQHTPLDGLRAALQNLVRLDQFLVGVPAAIALAVAGLIFAVRPPDEAALRARGGRKPTLLLSPLSRAEAAAVFAGIPVTFVLLFFYFWPGTPDTGPQLYHTAGAMLLPFVAAGALALEDRWRRPAGGIVVAVIVAALVTFWVSNLGALRRAARAGGEIPRLAARAGAAHALVFTDKYPWAGGHERSWVLGRPLPQPDLSDDVLYLQSQGPAKDRELAAALYPDRALWFLRQVDGKVALLPMDQYAGVDSLRAAAQARDLD